MSDWITALGRSFAKRRRQEAEEMNEQGFELQYETPKGYATPHFRSTDVEKLVQRLDRLRRRHIEATVLDMQTREVVGGVTPGDAINPWNYWLWSKPELEPVQPLIDRECRVADDLQRAWDELQAVPSYVEQQAAAWAADLGLEVAR